MRRLQALVGLVVLGLAGQAHVTSPPKAATYRVRPGDTLARLAARAGVSVDALAQANGIADRNRVLAGQVLTIPRPGGPAPAPASGPAPPPGPVPLVVVDGGSVHTVAAGQTLGLIARTYGTTVAELARANNLRNPNVIRQGVQLKVPGPPWVCPVQGTRQFSDTWGHPWGDGRRHAGVDIFARRGTPVVASVGGTVSHAPGARAGLAYYLRGDDGITYYGAHLDTLGPTGRVERGSVLGTVGSTGNAEGGTPHLHFEIKPSGGEPVNPYPTVRQWC